MNGVLKFLITITVLFNFGSGMLGPIYAIFVQGIGGDVLVASSTYAIYMVAVGVLMLIFGHVEDRLDRKKFYVIGLGLSFMGVLGYNFVSQPLHLFLVQGTLGVSLAMIIPVADSMFSRGTRRDHEVSEWSFWEASYYLTMGVGAVAGGFVVSSFGFKPLFEIMTCLSFAGFLVSLVALRRGVLE